MYTSAFATKIGTSPHKGFWATMKLNNHTIQRLNSVFEINALYTPVLHV